MVKGLKNDYKESHPSYDEFILDEQQRLSSSTIFNKLIWVIDDVCSATTYKKGTIYNLVSSGSIPYRKRRGKLFFIPNEVLSWVKNEKET